MWWLVILLLVQTARANAEASCCPDRNVFIFKEKQCIGHQNMSASDLPLNCTKPQKYIHVTDFVRRSGEDSIIMGDSFKFAVPPDKFCITRLVDAENDSRSDEAAIVCHSEDYEFVAFSAMMILYICCIFLSAVMLLLTFFVYLLVPELREVQDRCLMFTCLSLSIGHITIGVAVLQVFSVSGEYCSYQEIFTYFWMLACFFWLNIVSFNAWRIAMFGECLLTERQLMIFYCIFGWGGPLSLLIAALATEDEPFDVTEDDNDCWTFGPADILFLFVVPILLLMLMNVLYFICTGCRFCWGVDHSQSPYKIRSIRYKMMLYLKLFILTGIPWFFSIMGVSHTKSLVLEIIMNLLILLQGVFIFLILVVFRKRALRGMLKRFPCTRKYCPESWVAGEDHEDSEGILSEDVELSRPS